MIERERKEKINRHAVSKKIREESKKRARIKKKIKQQQREEKNQKQNKTKDEMIGKSDNNKEKYIK